MHYALVKTGGKQYRMQVGQSFRLEKLQADVGASIRLSEVLLVSNDEATSIGSPYVPGAAVEVEVIRHAKHPKIRIFKMKRRKNHRRTKGHRQWFTEVTVRSIVAP